eukprot:SAG22_NODE_14563_length_371_cov_0.944853_1_plen_85_part_01
MVLACDGVWDVFTPEQAAEIVLRYDAGDPQTAAEALADAALATGSRDNISVIVVTGLEQFTPEGAGGARTGMAMLGREDEDGGDL